MKKYERFEKRKKDHIELALMPGNQALELNNLDNLTLNHEALPNLDFDEIQTANVWLNKPAKPFFVSSMTAGHQDATKINYALISACAQSGWSMGVGSQRRELTDNSAAYEWLALRRDYPEVRLFSNLGIAQLITTPLSKIQQLTESLQAEALIIHCNPLQEALQPEGTPQFKGCWEALAKLVRTFHLPVVVKETGCGFSLETLKRLNTIGVAAVDSSGLGGTHWGRIEGHRAKAGSARHSAARAFRNWGIDTVQTIRYAASLEPNFEIWGSGGIRNGLDAAKLFALGVAAVGFAKPMLSVALKSTEQVALLMQTIEYELKVAMFCTGSRVLDDLRGKLCQ